MLEVSSVRETTGRGLIGGFAPLRRLSRATEVFAEAGERVVVSTTACTLSPAARNAVGRVPFSGAVTNWAGAAAKVGRTPSDRPGCRPARSSWNASGAPSSRHGRTCSPPRCGCAGPPLAPGCGPGARRDTVYSAGSIIVMPATVAVSKTGSSAAASSSPMVRSMSFWGCSTPCPMSVSMAG